MILGYRFSMLQPLSLCDWIDQDATQLHELYKQRSTSETWIEQVKGHVMAGETLTDDFWANDILWQLFQKSRADWSLLQLCRDEEIISEAN